MPPPDMAGGTSRRPPNLSIFSRAYKNHPSASLIRAASGHGRMVPPSAWPGGKTVDLERRIVNWRSATRCSRLFAASRTAEASSRRARRDPTPSVGEAGRVCQLRKNDGVPMLPKNACPNLPASKTIGRFAAFCCFGVSAGHGVEWHSMLLNKNTTTWKVSPGIRRSGERKGEA